MAFQSQLWQGLAAEVPHIFTVDGRCIALESLGVVRSRAEVTSGDVVAASATEVGHICDKGVKRTLGFSLRCCAGLPGGDK